VVTWTEPARNDLKAIYEYIALDSKFYAKNTVRNIVQRVSRLSTVPEIGRIVPEVNVPAVREIFTYSYRIIYQIQSDGLFILAVVHGHRDLHGDDIPVLDW
jgi:plasmid stabilization system protein ParE